MGFNEEWDIYCADVEKRAIKWKKKWPNHCKACGGWGGYASTINYGPGLNEPWFDVCEAIDNLEVCHRCGQKGLTEDAEGPCSFCGWNFDDGIPGP